MWSRETAEHYQRKHGVPCEVLPIPIEPVPELSERPCGDGEVLVAGAIYWAQEDAVRRLLRAAARVPRARVVALGDEDNLRRRGIVADRYEPSLPGDGFQRRVARADVAFPRAYRCARRIPRSCSRRPRRGCPSTWRRGGRSWSTLPPGSHVAEYARREDFAEVVDQPDEVALAEALGPCPRRSPSGRRRVPGEARHLAFERHDVERASSRLRGIAGANVGASPTCRYRRPIASFGLALLASTRCKRRSARLHPRCPWPAR